MFLPAIVGHVPDKMVQCIAALLDFAYIARRPAHDADSLISLGEALERFHELRTIFQEERVRMDDFSLPRQHALIHYIRGIKLFGSPNGLCSSITESKHIDAVKRLWRASSRNKPLQQMLIMNDRVLKLSAARSDFGRRGMLAGDVLSYVNFGDVLAAIEEEEEDEEAQRRRRERERDQDDDEFEGDGERADTIVSLAARPG